MRKAESKIKVQRYALPERCTDFPLPTVDRSCRRDLTLPLTRRASERSPLAKVGVEGLVSAHWLTGLKNDRAAAKRKRPPKLRPIAGPMLRIAYWTIPTTL